MVLEGLKRSFYTATKYAQRVSLRALCYSIQCSDPDIFLVECEVEYRISVANVALLLSNAYLPSVLTSRLFV